MKMTSEFKLGACAALYLAGMWVSGGWLYAEDHGCRIAARATEDDLKARGIHQSIEIRDCGYDSMHMLPGTVLWPVYWFVRSSREAFQ